MFGRATIRLGIGPHSSVVFILSSKVMLIFLLYNKSSVVAEMGDRLATIDMGRREGAGAAVPLSGGAGPHLTQCRLGRGLPPYQMVSSSIQPFGHNRHGPKIGGCAPLGGAGSPCNTTSLGPTSTSLSTFVPSGILIHPAVWPQQT